MVIFGLVLLLLAVLVVIAAVVGGGDPASLDMQLFTVKTNVTGVFVAGAVTLLVAVLGVVLLLKGLKHDRSRRAQIADLKKRASRHGSKTTSSSQPPTRTSTQPAPRTTSEAPSPGSASTPGSGGSTSADVRRDSGPDEHFESAPRDPAS